VVGRRKLDHVAKILVGADDSQPILLGVIGNVLVRSAPESDIAHVRGLVSVLSDQVSRGARETRVDQEIAHPIKPIQDGKRFARFPPRQKRCRLECLLP
jgi:hypothetical protein